MSYAIQVPEQRWAARRMVLGRWLIGEDYCAEGSGEPMCELFIDGHPTIIGTQADGWVGERYVFEGEPVPLMGSLALGSANYPGARLPKGMFRGVQSYSAADFGREHLLHDFKAFVSYRRTDAVAEATFLVDHINRTLGDRTAFIDHNSIALGFDYLECVHDALHRARVMFAVIGPNWPTTTDERGLQRLAYRFDPVRIEIRAALARGIPVVPVLVRDAVLPVEETLPEDIRGLVRRQAAFVRPTAFTRDVDDLLSRVAGYMSS